MLGLWCLHDYHLLSGDLGGDVVGKLDHSTVILIDIASLGMKNLDVIELSLVSV